MKLIHLLSVLIALQLLITLALGAGLFVLQSRLVGAIRTIEAREQRIEILEGLMKRLRERIIDVIPKSGEPPAP